MRRFLIALQFLTIIPIKINGIVEQRDFAKCSAYFPLVGAVQGIVLVAVNLLSSCFFSAEITSALILISLILTNGGFHLDGFADTVDGLAGGSTKEDRLRIMKDSQIGAIGVVAIVLLLLLKFLTINEIYNNNSPLTLNCILFLIPIIGKWSMLPMAYMADYARSDQGLGKSFTENTGIKALIVATIITLSFSIIFLSWLAIPYLVILFIMVYLFTLFFKIKLGGVTGDVLGFQSELTEILFLLIVIAGDTIKL